MIDIYYDNEKGREVVYNTIPQRNNFIDKKDIESIRTTKTKIGYKNIFGYLRITEGYTHFNGKYIPVKLVEELEEEDVPLNMNYMTSPSFPSKYVSYSQVSTPYAPSKEEFDAFIKRMLDITSKDIYDIVLKSIKIHIIN